MKGFFRQAKSVYLLSIVLAAGLVFVGWLTLLRGKFHRQPLCPDCNIILVSLDTLSANHLPCYGYERNTAPNLCAFGKENIMFEHAYADSYYTLPSHVTIFTGLYPGSHKVNFPYKDKLDPRIPFLPEILHESGYATHFGMIKTDQNLPLDNVFNRGIDSIDEPDESSTLWTRDLEAFRNNIAAGKKTFLFLHTYAVHAPYLIEGKPLYTDKQFDGIPTTKEQFYSCSKKFIGYMRLALRAEIARNNWPEKTRRYRQLAEDFSTDGGAASACADPRNEGLLTTFRYNFIFSADNINTPEKVRYARDLYDQKITELDRKLSALFDLMKDPLISKKTVLIITADHGEEFMEHGYITHKTLYDSNVRIPLLMHIPGFSAKAVSSLAESADLTPTILDLVGIKGQYRFQGASLTGALLGRGSGKGYAVAEHAGLNIQTIRDGTFKLFVKNENGTIAPYELYDTLHDPGESHNIIFGKPSVAEALARRLKAVRDKPVP